MIQAAIEALLRQKIGVDAALIGSSTIARAVKRRMADCGLSDMATYLIRLQTSQGELEELIENVVVPETWFFRDREPFAFLSGYVVSEWLPAHPQSLLRVLSVPCSTGEEPYSIAIALMESGLASKKFSIDAVDISKKSLRYAQCAVYSQNSFRGDTLVLQNRYFTQTADGYQLCESVRRTVNFIHGNLLDARFFQEKTPYNVIFCRNLLIYFDQSARSQTTELLYRLLTKDGLLFVGHSETRQISPPWFVSVSHPSAFAFRKVEEHLDPRKAREQESKIPLPAKGGKQRSRKESAPLPPFGQNSKSEAKNSPTPSHQTTDNKQTILETAKVLADRGQLNEAATLCETYLSQNRVSVEAYVLLGQVRQAAGNEEQALQCFQKAIYLEPNHYEALIHLALLKEHHGDLRGAAILRQRIQRLGKSEETD